jgi:hypothetical protein
MSSIHPNRRAPGPAGTHHVDSNSNSDSDTNSNGAEMVDWTGGGVGDPVAGFNNDSHGNNTALATQALAVLIDTTERAPTTRAAEPVSAPTPSIDFSHYVAHGMSGAALGAVVSTLVGFPLAGPVAGAAYHFYTAAPGALLGAVIAAVAALKNRNDEV